MKKKGAYTMTKKFNKGSQNQSAPQLHGKLSVVVTIVKELNGIKINEIKR